MPALFYLAVLAVAFQHVVDKILITYYFQAKPSHDTIMSYKIIKSIKYSVIPFLTIGSFIVTDYKCSAHGMFYSEEYNEVIDNECVQHNHVEKEFYALLFSGILLLVTLPVYQHFSDKSNQ